MPEKPAIPDEPGQPRAKSSAKGDSPAHAVLSGVWKIFTSQPGLGVVLFGTDGCIEYVNELFIKEYIPSNQMVGRLISEFLAEQVWDEMRGAIAKVEGTDKLLIRKVVYKGFETQITYRWLADESGGKGRILMTAQRGFPEPSEGEHVEIEQGGYMDLGSLSILTNRELEVLAYVGEGLRVKEIGAKLFRSPKTVESHLASIYRKLDTSDRAVLMGIAHDAGLNVDALSRTRVDAVRTDDKEKKAE